VTPIGSNWFRLPRIETAHKNTFNVPGVLLSGEGLAVAEVARQVGEIVSHHVV